MPINKYKAAVVTSEPVWENLEGGVVKTIDFIHEAGKAGCKLIAFPEVWIPGYPYWMWKVNYLQSLPMLKRYRENSIALDSSEMRRIRAAARDAQIYVSMGVSEIDHATLYLTQVLISPQGQIINHRRKIKPTHVEKLVYGDGSGDSFEPVTQTELGRLGQLNCWENMNPFLKALAVARGEQVHVAAWPVYPNLTRQVGPDPATNYADPASDLVTPAYAIETGTWVLAPFQRISVEGLKRHTPPGVEPETDAAPYNGHARIFRPDGSLYAKPSVDFDGLMFADIDLNESHLTKALADFAGHYMRPDLIRLLVDTRRKELVTEVAGAGAGAGSSNESVGVAGAAAAAAAAAAAGEGIKSYSTMTRLGLDRPLEEEPYRHGTDVEQGGVIGQEKKSANANGQAANGQ